MKNIIRYDVQFKKVNNKFFENIYKGIPQTQISKMLYYIGKNLTINKYISKKDFKDNFG